MKEKAPTMAELLEMRMDSEAIAGRKLADKISRGEGTRLDRMALRLKVIDQDDRRRQWTEELRNEGKRVSLPESPRKSFEKGLRITNKNADVVTVWLYGPIG